MLCYVMTSQDHSYTKFEHFEIIFLSYAPDKQTHKQIDSNVLTTPTDIVGVGNNKKPEGTRRV